MASPFVPVDLDKLLDEFEEKEEETKPEQLASAGTTDTDRTFVGGQRFQAPFPSIKEEVLSDQGSDCRISDDKSSSDSQSDSESDSDGVSGVIEAAEAITKQKSYQSQNTQGLLLDNFKQNVVVAENVPSENLDGNSALSTIKDSNSGSIELDEEKQLNPYGYVQLENEETEASSVSSELYVSKELVIPSDNSYCMEKEARNSMDVIASSVLYSETSPELHQEQTSSRTGADQERHFRDGDKYITEQAGVDDINEHSIHELIDLTVSLGDPGMSNTRLATKSEMEFSDESLGSLEEHITHTPGLDLKQISHGPGMHEEQLTSDGSYQDGHSAEQYAFGEPNQFDTLGITDSSSEPNETLVQTMFRGTSQDQVDDWYSNVNSNGEPNVTSQDPSQAAQAAQAGGPVASNILVALDTEVIQVPGSETQAVYDNQAGVSSDLTDVSSQGEASTDYMYDVVHEGNDLDSGSLPISNESDEHVQSPSLSPELDLTITMHSQGSLEARRITSGEANLGKVPPIWVPDSVATHCMNCGVKFSVIKRRHHCRACGKALCSSCCNMKFLLPYLDNKEGRVCQVCCNILLRAQALLQVVDNQTNENIRSDDKSPTDDLMLDNDFEEEDEELDEQVEQEIPESAEASADVPEDTTDFPGAEADLPVASGHTAPVLPPLQLPVALPQDMGDTPLATPTSPALSDDSDCLFRLDVDNVRSLLPQDITALPPVLKVSNEEISIHERPDPAEIMYQIKGLHETVVFLLNKNLVVKVSIVKLSCCVKRKCWCFVTEGMGAANQEEMVVLLECLRKETMLPKDVLSHFNTAFAYAKQGHTVSELGYTIFGQPFLGSSDNAGFLYIKPTYQCLKKLPLPSTPYVVGILIKRQETPWAQLFPLRLQLRLGAEYRYYPCPLFSSRNRSAVYGEVGHTIMNLLADFKNFQYTLARVTGLVIHMEEKKTLVRLPQDRYDEVVKILNATDEHVMALGANFSLQADSHLVCMQSEQGYKTQAINIQNQPRKVTGASFIVFSGAMKSSSPLMAKVNIIEDGIMVQLMPEAIAKLRNSLKEMKDYTIITGIPGGGGEEQVIVEWVSRKDAPCQSSLCSPIDGLQLDGFSSVKVHSGYDFTRKSALRIQWTEMFFLGDGQQSASRDLNKLTAELAKAFGRTLMAHLSKLSSDNCTFIGLRVNLDSENVGYFTGSNQQSLPASIMSDLDDVLVPVLHAAAGRHRGRALSVELLFKILRLL